MSIRDGLRGYFPWFCPMVSLRKFCFSTLFVSGVFFSILLVSGVLCFFHSLRVRSIFPILLVSGLSLSLSLSVSGFFLHFLVAIIFNSVLLVSGLVCPLFWCQVCFSHCFVVRSVFLSILLMSGLLMHSISVRSVFPFSWCQVCPFPLFCFSFLPVWLSVCLSVCIAAYSEYNGTQNLVGSLLVCLICGSCLVLCCPVLSCPSVC